MTAPYCIAAESVVEETEVNRSRFICYLTPCNEKVHFKQWLNGIQQEHPQASHHCYAFVIAHPLDSQNYGFSDDGEPSGTAGKPMLSVLQGSQVGEIAAVVVRYFGGTKLGTGGLQRAYSASVRNALEKLTTTTKIPMVAKTLACQYAQVNDILHLIQLVGGEVTEQLFTDSIELTLAVPEQNVRSFAEKLQTMSSGQLVLKNINQE